MVSSLATRVFSSSLNTRSGLSCTDLVALLHISLFFFGVYFKDSSPACINFTKSFGGVSVSNTVSANLRVFWPVSTSGRVSLLTAEFSPRGSNPFPNDPSKSLSPFTKGVRSIGSNGCILLTFWSFCAILLVSKESLDSKLEFAPVIGDSFLIPLISYRTLPFWLKPTFKLTV